MGKLNILDDGLLYGHKLFITHLYAATNSLQVAGN